MTFHVLSACGWLGNGERPQKGTSMIQSNEYSMLPYVEAAKRKQSKRSQLQAEADRLNLLLPTQLNGSPHVIDASEELPSEREAHKSADENLNLLLPAEIRSNTK